MAIDYINPLDKKEVIEQSDGLYQDGLLKFRLQDGAFRIVSDSNYTDNFGREWNEFQKTQIDKFSGKTISRERFFAQTGWDKTNLSGQNVLEVGSGAGRFSQIVLDFTQANLYSVDYSSAVEANFRNNGPNNRFKLFRASIYELPFKQNQFDKVFCFGVLQHTPDFKKSVQCLIEMVKPGGELVVDFYPVRGWYSKINAKYMLRPFTKSMNQDKLMNLIRKNVNWMITASNFFSKLGVGKITNRFIPVCDIATTIPANISKEQLREWVILDTFDMFSPAYDNPQSLNTVKHWFEEMGMQNVNARFIKYSGHFESAVVSALKP